MEQDTRDKIRALADEFQLKAHLASMEAKTLWAEELQPKLRDLEQKLDDATQDIDLSDDLQALERRLRKIVDDLIEK